MFTVTPKNILTKSTTKIVRRLMRKEINRSDNKIIAEASIVKTKIIIKKIVMGLFDKYFLDNISNDNVALRPPPHWNIYLA